MQAGFTATDGYIYYNTDVLNTYRSTDELEASAPGAEVPGAEVPAEQLGLGTTARPCSGCS